MGKKILYSEFLNLKCSLLALIVLVIACKPEKVVLKSPPGYDFSQIEKTVLDEELDEISGLAWDHNKNVFAAIKDERGRVYFLDKETKIIRDKFNFAGSGDFEDIAYVNSVPYIMKSDGTIFRCDLDSLGNASGTELGKIEIEGAVDFESMYYDAGRNSLVLVCKNCDMDKDQKRVSAFAFNLDSGSFNPQPIFQIDSRAVKTASPTETSRPEPSAAAIHPVQQKLYIVSSGSHQLIITDLNGTVEKVFSLAAKIFPQPEGICFKQSGDMYITNEGGTGRASLLKFTYNKQ